MPVAMKGGQSTPSSSADGRAGSTKRPARPCAELNQSSSADGRAGSTTRPARPSTELNQSSSADGRARSTTRPARPSAELDQSSSADGRAGSIVLSSSRPRSSPPPLGFERTCSFLSRSESPFELYDLKTPRTRSLE